jgi:HlyD family secretion protein
MIFNFRKKALEKLRAPEELDQILKIVSPSSWLLLIALIIAVIATFIWGIYGSIPSRISGKGIFLTRDNALVDAVAYEHGKILAVYVKYGQQVAKDELLLTITREDLDQKIDELKKKMMVLTIEKETVEKLIASEVDAQSGYVQKQAAAIQQIIDSRQKDLDYINDTLQKKELMVKQGYLTKDELESSLQKRREYTREIAISHSEILKLQNSIQEIQNTRNEKLYDIKKDYEDVKLELERTEFEQNITENIKSPSAGEIINIPVDIGDHVKMGQSVASILQPGNALNIVGFVSAEEESGKIAPNMEVLIEPAGIKREIYGSMIGKISFVSAFPVTIERLITILHNQDLAKKIALNSLLLEVHITPIQIQDPKTKKWQYRWTSKRGQNFIIKPGSLCKINVTVERNPPITLVIPTLKKIIGVY